MKKANNAKKIRQTKKNVGDWYITTISYDGILLGSRVTIKDKTIQFIRHRGYCVKVEDEAGRIGWIPNKRLVKAKGTVEAKYAKKRKD